MGRRAVLRAGHWQAHRHASLECVQLVPCCNAIKTLPAHWIAVLQQGQAPRPDACPAAAACRTSTKHILQLPAMDSRWW